MHKTRTAPIVVALLAISLQGCGGVSVGRETAGSIEISSDPSGATALVDGVDIGTTPLRVDPAQVFRSGFAGLSYRYLGRLVVTKPGCTDQVVEVNDAVLSKDIRVTLACDPNYRATTPAAPESQSVAPAGAAGDPYAERLQRIEMLYRKGLITEEEYRASRKRIIDKL